LFKESNRNHVQPKKKTETNSEIKIRGFAKRLVRNQLYKGRIKKTSFFGGVKTKEERKKQSQICFT
jgi:hypothetical protein